MVVPHWSGRNSTMISWWCLISHDVIPRWFCGDASWSERNSMTPVSGSSWW